ncbi:ankyrin [Aspergillus ellipticus CBS 707.79]|uniref:Ankyrin n=1 Tax=Aspergillus ellipticus CBS 707.79 TaxID=1448320 RepID=A0A319DNP7_9EURO|nr:ankyrin [Aspergillus ellipticus CBS 707.79]
MDISSIMKAFLPPLQMPWKFALTWESIFYGSTDFASYRTTWRRRKPRSMQWEVFTGIPTSQLHSSRGMVPMLDSLAYPNQAKIPRIHTRHSVTGLNGLLEAGHSSRLFYLIVEQLEYESELSALARTDRALYEIVNPILYRHNVRYGDSSALVWAIEHEASTLGADIEARDDERMTPLALAAQGGSHEVVQFLLSRGADPSIIARREMTPLCCAAMNDYTECVKLLLDAGTVEAVVRHRGRSSPAIIRPLNWSLEEGRDDVVEILLEKTDYIPLLTDPSGRTTFLCAAASRGKTALVRDLLQNHGYDADDRDVVSETFQPDEFPTALCWAADRGHTEVVELLLAHGANPCGFPSLRDHRRKPLFRAINKGFDPIVALLLGAGVDPNSRTSDETSGPPALYEAVPFESIFRRLLEAGADPTAGGVVSRVLFSGKLAEIEMLLDWELDLSQHIGNCSLVSVAIHGGHAILEFLLQQSRWNDCFSPEILGALECENTLSLAVSIGDPDVVHWLLDRGFLTCARTGIWSSLIRLSACSGASDADVSNTIDLILQYAAGIDEELDLSTVHLICHDYSDSRARMMLDRGASALKQRDRFYLPLYEAIQPSPSFYDILETLLRETEEKGEP